MKSFDLYRGTSVLIYGAGLLGREIYGKVKGIYDVKCYVDRKTDVGVSTDIPVRDLEHIAEYRGCVVIICVHNGNWHYEIAEDLFDRGFEKILFLALNDTYKETEALCMNRIYNFFIEEQYDCLREIPCYQEMKGTDFKERIIRKNDKYVTAYCGRELLYSYDKIDEHQKDKISQEALLFWDVPMSAFKPFTSLFRYFMFGEGNSDLYVRNMRRLNNSFDMGEEEFLHSQYLIYQLLEKEYEKGIEVLQYSPIDVKWNPRGYFNVVDGHHRCTFYYLKGMQNLPVRMTREDYETWMNAASADRIKEILNGNADILRMKISHPVLANGKCRYMEHGKTVLDVMQEWIYEGGYTFCSVIELSDCQAYYSRNLYRMKRADTITALACSEEDRKVALALNDLQYVPGTAVRITDSAERCFKKHQFDLALMCGMYDVHELEEIMELLDHSVLGTIFWQSKSDIEAEKAYILSHSDFCGYRKLAVKCLNGQLCEIGVFTRG